MRTGEGELEEGERVVVEGASVMAGVEDAGVRGMKGVEGIEAEALLPPPSKKLSFSSKLLLTVLSNRVEDPSSRLAVVIWPLVSYAVFSGISLITAEVASTAILGLAVTIPAVR